MRKKNHVITTRNGNLNSNRKRIDKITKTDFI